MSLSLLIFAGRTNHQAKPLCPFPGFPLVALGAFDMQCQQDEQAPRF